MSFNSVGSVACDDVMLEIYPYCNQLNVHNMTENVDDSYLINILESNLKDYELNQHGIAVYYNGADPLIVSKRFKELKKLVPFIVKLQKYFTYEVS